MIVETLTLAVVSLVVLVGCFRLGEWYPWLLETKAKQWLMVTMFASSAVSAISFILFIVFSIGK